MKSYMNKIVEKIGDIIGLVGILLSDMVVALLCLAVMYMLLDICFPSDYVALTYWILGGYILSVSIIIIRGIVHYTKWFILNRKMYVYCHSCGEKVAAIRKEVWDSDEYATVYILYSIESIQRTNRIQKYRPMMYYKCSSCGHEEYICPYCHKPVSKENDKCPHCQKRIIRNTRI